MTLDMQPSHFPSFPFTLAAYNNSSSPFPPTTTPAPIDFTAFSQHQPPYSHRTSRKRGYADVDDAADGDSNGALHYNKRQEIQRDMPAHSLPSPVNNSSQPTPPSTLPAPPHSHTASAISMQPSPPLSSRTVSPAGSDTSMSDDADFITAPTDESGAAVASSGRDEQTSDYYRSAALIRPVLPLPSLSSSAIVELYKQQQRRQQQAEHDEHDPSKQLVLYQPVQPLVQLAAVGGSGGGRSGAALRRAQQQAQANMFKDGASGLYEWGDISDNNNNAMQT